MAGDGLRGADDVRLCDARRVAGCGYVVSIVICERNWQPLTMHSRRVVLCACFVPRHEKRDIFTANCRLETANRIWALPLTRILTLKKVNMVNTNESFFYLNN